MGERCGPSGRWSSGRDPSLTPKPELRGSGPSGLTGPRRLGHPGGPCLPATPGPLSQRERRVPTTPSGPCGLRQGWPLGPSTAAGATTVGFAQCVVGAFTQWLPPSACSKFPGAGGRTPQRGVILACPQCQRQLPAVSWHLEQGEPMRALRLLAVAPQWRQRNWCRPGLAPDTGRWSSHGTNPSCCCIGPPTTAPAGGCAAAACGLSWAPPCWAGPRAGRPGTRTSFHWAVS